MAQAIVDHQTEFLNKGPESIEPLKMQQIADKVGVHVTTVSRAVDDKWIQTPRGIFPLKRFFCGGAVGADGEEVAWDTIRLKLQELIDGEDKPQPKSDEQLVKDLAGAGDDRRPADGDEVPQGDEHPQFAAAAELDGGQGRAGQRARRARPSRTNQHPMKCPFCQADNDRVIDSRASQDGFATRRRRECLNCKAALHHLRAHRGVEHQVVKKDGSPRTVRPHEDQARPGKGLLEAPRQRRPTRSGRHRRGERVGGAF